MAGDSKIEWTDATWNPIVGCSIVSPGCTNCYAMRTAARMNANPATPHYHGTVESSKVGPVWTGKVALAPDYILTTPLHWKKPRRIFVNSMGDLFHESIPDEWIDKVFAVMALSPQHTFQVLTKRAERMRDYFAAPHPAPNVSMWQVRVCAAIDALVPDRHDASRAARHTVTWNAALPNVWLGISAERQQEADERIPHLLQTPAAIRFVSAEPLLGAIDFTNLDYGRNRLDVLAGTCEPHTIGFDGLDWIIVGGESGPRAREFDLAWARWIIEQCRAAGVACFVKQLGARVANSVNQTTLTFKDRKGGDWSEWPEDLRIRQFPNPQPSSLEATIPGCSERERVAAITSESQS
jgi:protein gp37